LVSVYGLTEEDARKIADGKVPATPASAPETPAELEAEIKLLKKISPPSETFTMKDDPDFQLSEKELNMVAKAVGLKNKPIKKKKAN